MNNLYFIISILLAFSLNNNNIATLNSKISSKNNIYLHTQKSFKKNELIGKWYFLSKDNDEKTKSENLLEGRFIKFNKNKKYYSNVINETEKGVWSFNEESQILTLTNGDKKSEWKPYNINEFGMILINQMTKEKWNFALAN